MENIVEGFRDRYKNLALTMMANCLKFSQNVSNIREEEQRKLKSNEDLAKRIAEMEAQVDSIVVEESKVKEEKKKLHQKNAELQAKLKKETIKADDLQLVAGREKASMKSLSFFLSWLIHSCQKTYLNYVILEMEEEEQLCKNIHDKASVLLKPYHDILGLTFQRSRDPQDNLRFIFKMPNGKKCVVKLTKDGLKSNYFTYVVSISCFLKHF